MRRRATRRLCGAFGLGSFVGLSVVAPIYFEGAFALDADGVGVALIGPMIGVVVGATISGRLMPHLTRYKAPGLIGLAFAAAASAFLALGLKSLSLGALDALLTTISVGIGTTLPISTVSLQNAVERRNLGSATAVMQFSRQIGCALIVALLGALVMGAGAAALEAEAASPQAIEALRGAFREVFAATTIFVGIALFFLARMEEKPLRNAPAP